MTEGIALVIAFIAAALLVWGRRHVIRFLRWTLRGPAPLEPRLGDEAIDFDVVNGANRGLMAIFGNRSDREMQAWFVKQIPRARPTPRHPTRYDEVASAKRLVQGIATHNDTVLFMNGPRDAAGNNADQTLCKVLDDLGVTFKAVDVSSDPTMHLGIPEQKNEPKLPVLYVKGMLIGGADVATKMAHDGQLKALFAR